MSYLIHSKSHQSSNIFACSDIKHGTQGDILQDVKENLVIMPSCLHAPLPSCPSSTLSSEDDVRWWLGWVRMVMLSWPAACSLQCDLTWSPVTRVCLATEGEQLSVECGLEKCVTTVTCCSYGHTRGWGDREADSGHCDQHTAGHERGHLDTHIRTLMGPVPVEGICCGFFSLHLMFLANNQMIWFTGWEHINYFRYKNVS